LTDDSLELRRIAVLRVFFLSKPPEIRPAASRSELEVLRGEILSQKIEPWGPVKAELSGDIIGGGEIGFTPGEKGGINIKTVNAMR